MNLGSRDGCFDHRRGRSIGSELAYAFGTFGGPLALADIPPRRVCHGADDLRRRRLDRILMFERKSPGLCCRA
jgi:hypothetical protein